jgi:hypothetical protein
VSAPGSELRVRVLDTWDEYPFRLVPGASVADLKREVLGQAGIRRHPDEYEVKYNGAHLDESGRSLTELGLPPNAAVIVLPSRRRPAR